MRMLEIGAANRPSEFALSAQCNEYVAVDPVYVDPTWRTDFGNCMPGKIQSYESSSLGSFDLVYGANVLSNRPTEQEKLKIVERGMELKTPDGLVVVIENYTPKQSGLEEIASKLGGTILFEGQAEFHEIWKIHRSDQPKLFDKIYVA